MSGIPNGWTACMLSDLVSYVTSGSRDWSRYYADEGALFVRTQDINRNRLGDLSSVARVGLPEQVEGKRTLIQVGDVLITITGANVGRCAVVSEPLPEAYVSQSVALVRPVDGALAPYIQRHLTAPEPELGTTWLEQSAYGLGRPVLSLDNVRETPIRLAPIAEQRRIVAKLDALNARTARARADLDRIPALAARYKQAVLAKAFSGELTAEVDAAKFAPVSFAAVIESTFYGPRFNKEAYCELGVPTLRTTDFDDFGRVVPKGPPQVSVSAKELDKWGLREGDLLVTRTGSIGKCAVYEASMGPALPSAYLIRTRLDLSRLVPRFALLFLLSPSGQEQLGLGITAVTQPNINAGVIERLQLPVPSLEVQAEIIAKVDAMFVEIDRLTAEAAAARRLLDRLDQAILAKAFRGELVPQNPADEPASVLLERVRAERAAAPKPRRGRRAAA